MINSNTHKFKKDDIRFWETALSWQDSVSPKIIKRVLFFVSISIITTALCEFFPELTWSVGPLEISGAALGLILVIRTNAGYDRWWEARKLWGGIVNQSRNLAITGLQYGVKNPDWQKKFIQLITEFPKETAKVLRGEVQTNTAILKSNEISGLISMGYRNGAINGFALQIIEDQRSLLVDYLGGCERILKTPLPKILDIKVRRFITLYLLLAPLGLTEKMGWYTPLLVLLLAYTLLAFDQIGVELQNPFSKTQLSALPLDEICTGIDSVLGSVLKNNTYKHENDHHYIFEV